MGLTIFTAGTKAKASEVNNNYSDVFKLINEKAINDVTATASGVLAVSSQKMIDKFLDSTGQNNTVDTGTTTGTYDPTNKYYFCGYWTALAQPQTNALDSTNSGSAPRGIRISVDQNCSLYSVTKSRTTGDRLLIKNDAGTTLYSEDYSSGAVNPLILTAPYPLVASSGYRIEIAEKGGGPMTMDIDTSPSVVDNAYINYVSGSASGSDTGSFYGITSMTIKHTLADSIVQSAVTTVPTGMTKCYVTPLMYEALSGSDNITADVSIDNGSHYTTAVPINTWTAITSANGTQLIVKMNLDTSTGASSPKVLGWCVLLE